MPDESLEQRINELESKTAFQDDAITALNDALAHQQQTIRQLQRSMEKLIEQINEDRDQQSDPANEPPPPHY